MKKIIFGLILLLPLIVYGNDGIGTNRNKRDRVVIAMITNDKYALPTGVAITSIQQNKKDTTDLKIYVITDHLSNENKRLLSQIGCTLIKHKLNPALDKVFVGRDNKIALLKFDLPNILPEEEKIIYLDSDTIIQADLAELFNTELNEHYAAAVYDPGVFANDRRVKLGLKKYFNSGVMVLNLKKMRKDDISQKLIQYRSNQEQIFADQDTFNVIFNENVIFLNLKYNFFANVASDRYANNPEGKINISDVVIIHEVGELKSWKDKRTACQSIWRKYYEQSPYKDIEYN